MYSAKGLSGVIKVGGRKAANLGRWELSSHGGGLFTCEVQVVECDDYLLSMPREVRKELHLYIGQKAHVYRNIEIGGAGDSRTISGQGPMTVRDL